MCGIAGFIDRAGGDAFALTATARGMAEAIDYRGPDEADTFVDGAAGFAVGHRRLSIVDLSAAGHQPMTSACGRCVIAYNGEIYNAREVAAELPHVRWRGHSDTEVLVEACAAFGVEAAVPRFIGMFAFVLWDKAERRLSLVRDRLGIKPLYYGSQGPLFLFGSELKALRAHAGWTPRLDAPAIAAYLRLGYVPAPLSALTGIHKLRPGHIFHRDADGRETETCYWDMRQKAIAGQRSLDNRPAEAIIADVETLLKDAVKRRMVADVPLGAFLSGGIDSPTVVALMQAQSTQPVRTFTIGFRDEAFNEAARARAIAAHLGTDHTELIVEPDEARAVIPLLPDMYDEPFADYSQIPTYLVSKLARSGVTVSLSGDGGDEVFGGYTRYAGIDRLWSLAGRAPALARRAASGVLRTVSPALWDALTAPLPHRLRPAHVGDKIHKGADILGQCSADAMYARLVSLWPDAARSADRHVYPWNEPKLVHEIPDLVARLRTLDMMTYLPDDILAKLDRATMAVSLEGRVPILDHRVVELAWHIPRDLLIRGGRGKWLLRQILHRHVPRELVQQPKMGFSIPLGDWLRGPLRDWAEDLLAEKSLVEAGMVDAKAVRDVWGGHLSGRLNRPHHLWVILMLQAWLRRWSSHQRHDVERG